LPGLAVESSAFGIKSELRRDFLTPFGGRHSLDELIIFRKGIVEFLQGDVLRTRERAVDHVGLHSRHL